MFEDSLFIINSDYLHRRKPLLIYLLERGFQIQTNRRVSFSPELAAEFYDDIANEEDYMLKVILLSKGNSEAFIVAKENATEELLNTMVCYFGSSPEMNKYVYVTRCAGKVKNDITFIFPNYIPEPITCPKPYNVCCNRPFVTSLLHEVYDIVTKPEIDPHKSWLIKLSEWCMQSNRNLPNVSNQCSYTPGLNRHEMAQQTKITSFKQKPITPKSHAADFKPMEDLRSDADGTSLLISSSSCVTCSRFGSSAECIVQHQKFSPTIDDIVKAKSAPLQVIESSSSVDLCKKMLEDEECKNQVASEEHEREGINEAGAPLGASLHTLPSKGKVESAPHLTSKVVSLANLPSKATVISAVSAPHLPSHTVTVSAVSVHTHVSLAKMISTVSFAVEPSQVTSAESEPNLKPQSSQASEPHLTLQSSQAISAASEPHLPPQSVTVSVVSVPKHVSMAKMISSPNISAIPSQGEKGSAVSVPELPPQSVTVSAVSVAQHVSMAKMLSCPSIHAAPSQLPRKCGSLSALDLSVLNPKCAPQELPSNYAIEGEALGFEEHAAKAHAADEQDVHSQGGQEQDARSHAGEEKDAHSHKGHEQDARTHAGQEEDAPSHAGEEQDAHSHTGHEQDTHSHAGQEQDAPSHAGEEQDAHSHKGHEQDAHSHAAEEIHAPTHAADEQAQGNDAHSQAAHEQDIQPSEAEWD